MICVGWVCMCRVVTKGNNINYFFTVQVLAAFTLMVVFKVNISPSSRLTLCHGLSFAEGALQSCGMLLSLKFLPTERPKPCFHIISLWLQSGANLQPVLVNQTCACEQSSYIINLLKSIPSNSYVILFLVKYNINHTSTFSIRTQHHCFN